MYIVVYFFRTQCIITNVYIGNFEDFFSDTKLNFFYRFLICCICVVKQLLLRNLSFESFYEYLFIYNETVHIKIT